MKPITLTAEDIAIARMAFDNYLQQLRTPGDSIDFKFKYDKRQTLPAKLQKATVILSAKAYLKMKQLIASSNKELAWHGLVTKRPNSLFIVSDILCYPQKATAATVESNDDAYPQWLMGLSDTEINSLRFQGHSHPSFSTSPSGVDLAYYESILSTLRNDEFYIFVIMNKKGEMSVLLYDLATNAIYETKDVLYTIVDNKHRSIHHWAEEQMKAFCTERPIPAASTPAATNVNRFDSRNLIWAYNSLGNQIQMEERYVEHCLECGTPNAKVRETCARCGAKVYSTLK